MFCAQQPLTVFQVGAAARLLTAASSTSDARLAACRSMTPPIQTFDCKKHGMDVKGACASHVRWLSHTICRSRTWYFVGSSHATLAEAAATCFPTGNCHDLTVVLTVVRAAR